MAFKVRRSDEPANVSPDSLRSKRFCVKNEANKRGALKDVGEEEGGH